MAIDPEHNTIRLPKIGLVRAKLHRLPCEDWILKAATVSRDSKGDYYCSVLFEYKDAIVPVEHPENNAIGLIIALFCLNIRMPLFLLSIRKTMRSGWTINPTDCIPIRKETSVDHLSIIARGRNV